MLTLAIDTSTGILSVALVQGDDVLATVDEQTKNNQSEILMSRIERMMARHQLQPIDLERIAVAVGPGSYTGIRVGVAAAKSLGYTLDIPVVGVSSLEVMAQGAGAGIVVPMIDARRGTVFAGAYDQGKSLIPDGHYDLEDLLGKLNVKQDRLIFVVDGAAVYKERLSKIAHAVIMVECDFDRSKAEILARLAHDLLPQENIHQLVPNYLRKTEAELNAGG